MREIPELDNLTHYKTWLLVGRVDAKCQHLLTTGLSEVGLSVAQYEVLHAIYRDEGLSQQRLARKLLVAKSNVTVLAQRLESNGLIRRERDPHDGRGHCLFLTDPGRESVEQGVRVQAEVVELMAKGLTGEQAKMLVEIMSRAEENLDVALSR